MSLLDAIPIAPPPRTWDGTLRSPIPWFGGKSMIASEVWSRFGEPRHYIEPFAGMASMLLRRPTIPPGAVETINDANAYLVNFWRAVAAEPDAVAVIASQPVFEADLRARHDRLIEVGDEIREAITSDPHRYFVEYAGWWAWGQSCWIGGRFCEPAADGGGKRQIPHLSTPGQGLSGMSPDDVAAFLRRLQERIRYVRIACGDWKRVCGSASTLESIGPTTAVFLDPPYSIDETEVYGTHSDKILSKKVRRWCIDHGRNPSLRIALCGYDGEGHEALEGYGWDVYAWSAQGGYSNLSGEDKTNRHRERVWFSPGCLRPPTLFDRVESCR